MGLILELEAYLHHHIPISATMGARVLEANDERVRLEFPLEPNINHQQTVFGGNESSAMILSAWSLLWVRLRERSTRPKLVIRANTTEYTKPIVGTFVAETEPIDAADWAPFLDSLDRKGKGRLQIRSVLLSEGQVCAEFSGTFIALAN